MTNSKEKLKLDDLRLIEHHNKGGIGSRQIRFGKLAFIDPCPITENPEEVLTSVHLNKVEFVEVVNDTQDGDEKKQYIICFLDDAWNHQSFIYGGFVDQNYKGIEIHSLSSQVY